MAAANVKSELSNVKPDRVPIVGKQSQPVEMAPKNTVTRPVAKPLTELEKNDCVAFATSRSNKRNCDYCNAVYEFKRQTSKYCCSNCRLNAHYVRRGRYCSQCGERTAGVNHSLCEVHRAEYWQAKNEAKNET